MTDYKASNSDYSTADTDSTASSTSHFLRSCPPTELIVLGTDDDWGSGVRGSIEHYHVIPLKVCGDVPPASTIQIPCENAGMEITRTFFPVSNECFYSSWLTHPELHGFYVLAMDRCIDPTTGRPQKILYGFYLAPGACQVTIKFNNLYAMPLCTSKSIKNRIFDVNYTLATGERTKTPHYIHLRHGHDWCGDTVILDVCTVYLGAKGRSRFTPQMHFRYAASNLTTTLFESVLHLMSTGPFKTTNLIAGLTGISDRQCRDIRDEFLYRKHTCLRVFYDMEMSNLSHRVYPCTETIAPLLYELNAGTKTDPKKVAFMEQGEYLKGMAYRAEKFTLRVVTPAAYQHHAFKYTYCVKPDLDTKAKSASVIDLAEIQDDWESQPYAMTQSFALEGVALQGNEAANTLIPPKIESCSSNSNHTYHINSLSIGGTYKHQSQQSAFDCDDFDLQAFKQPELNVQPKPKSPTTFTKRPGRPKKATVTVAASICYGSRQPDVVSMDINGDHDKVKLTPTLLAQPHIRGLVQRVFDIGDFKPVRVYVDEISLVGRNFITLFTGVDANGKKELVYVANTNKKQVVYEFVEFIGPERSRGVAVVSCDMNAGFSNAFRELLPHVLIVFDPFHWLNHFNEMVIEVLPKVITDLKKSETTDPKDIEALEQYGIRLFISKPSRLSETELKTRKNLAELHPVLRALAAASTALHQSLEATSGEEMRLYIHEAIQQLEEAGQHPMFKGYQDPRIYAAKGQTDFRKVRHHIRSKGKGLLTMPAHDNLTDADMAMATKRKRKQNKVNPPLRISAMLDTHEYGVITFAETKQSNGLLEGINNSCKVVKRDLYGVKNVDRYKLLLKEQIAHDYHRNTPVCRLYLADRKAA